MHPSRQSLETPAGRVTSLWPTHLLHAQLPGAQAANEILARTILDIEKENPGITTDYRSTDFLENSHPAVKWLAHCINTSVADYMKLTGIEYEVSYSLHGWINVNRQGDYHELHNHPHCYLSGTYYVAMPEQMPNPGRRDDASPGCISFYDPRPQANMTALRSDATVDPAHTVLPSAGDLMIWPAFMHHFVHPNASADPRISISFNAMVSGAREYLPDQD